MDADFESRKLDVMYEVESSKFSDGEVARKLMHTYPRELIEGTTWHDNYWGDCTCARCSNRKGENHLGDILMHVRRDVMDAYGAFFVPNEACADPGSPDPQHMVSHAHAARVLHLADDVFERVFAAGMSARACPAPDGRRDLFYASDWDGIRKGLSDEHICEVLANHCGWVLLPL